MARNGPPRWRNWASPAAMGAGEREGRRGPLAFLASPRGHHGAMAGIERHAGAMAGAGRMGSHPRRPAGTGAGLGRYGARFRRHGPPASNLTKFPGQGGGPSQLLELVVRFSPNMPQGAGV